MEVVDHVHIIEIGRRSLVGYVDRVLQGNVPDGESLKLGIAGLHPTLILIIELGETDRHLTASRTWSRHHDKRTSGLHIVVLSETILAVYEFNIRGVALNQIMVIDLYATQTLQPLTESHR